MEPRHGATYAQILALAGDRRRGLRRVLPLRPPVRGGPERPDVPADRLLDDAGRTGPGHQPDPARLAGHRRHVPPTRPARHDRRERGRDERRTGRAGPGQPVVPARARGVRHPLPAARRAVRPAGRTVGDHHRAVVPSPGRGSRFSFAGKHYRVEANPRRPDRRSARTRRSSSVAPGRSARPPSRPGSPTSSTAPSATTCARASRGSTRPASGSAATRPRSATRPCCRWSARPRRPR